MRNNCYHTTQKELILTFLKQKKQQFVSANDILVYLLNQDEKIGLTTIYRYLKTLEEEGKLRTDRKESTRVYQYVDEGCQNHFHLKCEKCGKMEHIEKKEVQAFQKKMKKEYGFEIDVKNAMIGTCKKCQSK